MTTLLCFLTYSKIFAQKTASRHGTIYKDFCIYSMHSKCLSPALVYIFSALPNVDSNILAVYDGLWMFRPFVSSPPGRFAPRLFAPGAWVL